MERERSAKGRRAKDWALVAASNAAAGAAAEVRAAKAKAKVAGEVSVGGEVRA
jgi:hypothetical protein